MLCFLRINPIRNFTQFCKLLVTKTKFRATNATIRMTPSKNTILVLQSRKSYDPTLASILNQFGYSVINAWRIETALENISEGNINLIICWQTLNEEMGLSIFKHLKPFIHKTGIPFFLVLESYNRYDIEIGLEMGIDNFIILPFNPESIHAKIQDAFAKRTDLDFLNLKHFKNYFLTSSVAMFYVDKNVVRNVNEAFCELVNQPKGKIIDKPVDLIFNLTENPENELKYKRFRSGLSDTCKVEPVSCYSKNKITYNISFYRGNQATDSSVFAEVLPVNMHQLYEEELPQTSVPYIDSSPQASILSSAESVQLTSRELDVFKLSAQGLALKQVAAKLNVSQRTVEKHRSNIMRKTGTHSIFEAILSLQKSPSSK